MGITGATGNNGVTGATGSTGNTGNDGVTGPTGAQGVTGVGATGATGSNGITGATGSAGLQGATGVGTTGATGATGNNGVTGAVGSTGNTGNDGITGPTGAQGITGVGATGATGSNGITGATGSSGLQGATGVGTTGATGASGATGNSGVNGITGNTGVTGSTGLAGSTGAIGVTGVTGANGDTGATGSNGITGSTGNVGATGANGATGLVGATGSNGVTGVTGSNGATGANGVTGVTGSNGITGSTGNVGATGANGATGLVGATGSNGVTGVTGSNGATGANGATGVTGSNGITGATGAIGATGNAGSTGATGNNGVTGASGSTGATGLDGALNAWGITGNTGTTASTSAIGSTVNNNFIGTTTNTDFVVATNSLERIRIKGSSFLNGFGEQSPQYSLDVKVSPDGLAPATRNGLRMTTNGLTNDVSNGLFFGFDNSSFYQGASLWNLGNGGSGAAYLRFGLNSFLSTEVMRITDQYTVGIGITNPTAVVQLTSTSGIRNGIMMTQPTMPPNTDGLFLGYIPGDLYNRGVLMHYYNSNLVLGTNSAEVMTIYPTYNVGIGTIANDPSALLELNSSKSGFLIPRVALTGVTDATTITSPTTSLLVYNTNASISGGYGIGYYYNSGSNISPSWKQLQANIGDSIDWHTTGNSGTAPSTSAIGTAVNNNFMGTTDNKDLVFAANQLEKLRIKASTYQVGISEPNPAYTLDIKVSPDDVYGPGINGLRLNHPFFSSSTYNGIALGFKDMTTGTGATLWNMGSNGANAQYIMFGLNDPTQGQNAVMTLVPYKVGIGVFNPISTLNIQDNGGYYNGLTISNPLLPSGNLTSSVFLGIEAGTSITDLINYMAGGSLKIGAAGLTQLFIDGSTGKLAINNNAGLIPTNQLDVSDATDPVRFRGLQISSTDDTVIVTTNPGVLKKRAGSDLPANKNDWHITGNSSTVDGTNFIGTIDNIPLNLRVHNQKAGRIESATPFNTSYGYQSLNSNNSASYNAAFGYQALYSNGLSSASGNNAIGYQSLYTNTLGAFNTANGYMTLNANQSGNYNIATGAQALQSNISGGNNIGEGDAALYKNTIGNSNIAIGIDALFNNTTLSNQVAVGDSALFNNYSGGSNTAVGSKALFATTIGSSNNAFGNSALYNNTTGYSNEAFGNGALITNTSGYQNVGIGDFALALNTSGFLNVAVGDGAMDHNTQGDHNTAVGFWALRLNTTGTSNTATGFGASYSNAAAAANTADGYYALYNNAGSGNAASGYYALELTTTGGYNTAIGYYAMESNTTGSNNVAVGASAFPTSGGGLNNYVGLGYNVGYGTSISNSVELGNTSITRIQGQVAMSTYSDARIKDNIEANVPGLDFIGRLRPVTYNLNIHKQNAIMYANKPDQKEWEGKYDIEKMKMTGFIAQEVDSAAEAVGYNFSGLVKPTGPNDLYQVRYSDFVAPLVKSVQELKKMVDDLKLENETMKRELEILKKK